MGRNALLSCNQTNTPESLVGLAALTIGLGPNFEVGCNAEVVVETAWGDDLGRVICEGRAKELSGEPQCIAGHGRDRYIYASSEGNFETSFAIGAAVTAGQPVACIGENVVLAPLSGVIRGITHEGVRVAIGTKVLEIDPRGNPEAVFGIGERSSRIAAGVLQALS